MPNNDNEHETLRPTYSADPHGQAALLLVESLIHGLMERSVLTAADAVEIVTTAIEVQAEVAEAADGAGERMWQSYTLLSRIAESLRLDVGRADGADGADVRP